MLGDFVGAHLVLVYGDSETGAERDVEVAVAQGGRYRKFNVHAGDAREFRVISCDSCRSTKDPALESAQLAKVVPYSFETPLSAPLRTITLSLRFSVPTLED